MKKPLTYKQRLALKVNAAVSNMEANVSYPYDFPAYAKAVASTQNKRLKNHRG